MYAFFSVLIHCSGGENVASFFVFTIASAFCPQAIFGCRSGKRLPRESRIACMCALFATTACLRHGREVMQFASLAYAVVVAAVTRFEHDCCFRAVEVDVGVQFRQIYGNCFVVFL